MTAQRRDVLVQRLRTAGCVFAEQEADLLLAEASDAELVALAARRVAGEPLEHVLGWAEFCGMRIAVVPGVFVPRPRSEFLVARVARLVSAGSVVVDLCCGSGAIGVAVASLNPGLEVHVVDSDRVAADCAAVNLAAAQGSVYCGDLYDPLPERLRGRIDVLVANAPYIPSAQMSFLPREARDHEPPAALDGGGDGLDVHRRIAAQAPRWLRRGGHLVIETSAGQAGAATDMMRGYGLIAEVFFDADRDATAVVAARPSGEA